MDQQLTSDGKPYSPIRYKELVTERYYISKNTNISYMDTGQMTPVERRYILEYIQDEIKQLKENQEEQMKALKRN